MVYASRHRAEEYTYAFTDEYLQEIFDSGEAIKARGVDGEEGLKKVGGPRP